MIHCLDPYEFLEPPRFARTTNKHCQWASCMILAIMRRSAGSWCIRQRLMNFLHKGNLVKIHTPFVPKVLPVAGEKGLQWDSLGSLIIYVGKSSGPWHRIFAISHFSCLLHVHIKLKRKKDLSLSFRNIRKDCAFQLGNKAILIPVSLSRSPPPIKKIIRNFKVKGE